MSMKRMWTHTVVALAIATAWACGDDSEGESQGSSAALDACHAQCEAQERVTGGSCKPLVDLQACKQLCGLLVADVDPDCRDEFAAYYQCSANQGFMCLGSLVSQASEPCKNAMDQVKACEGTPMCQGADEDGICPGVSCPCPDGAKMVSGFSNEGGKCACYDAKTCVDFFCD